MWRKRGVPFSLPFSGQDEGGQDGAGQDVRGVIRGRQHAIGLVFWLVFLRSRVGSGTKGERRAETADKGQSHLEESGRAATKQVLIGRRDPAITAQPVGGASRGQRARKTAKGIFLRCSKANVRTRK